MRIREATVDDAPGIARVHVDSWRATYTGIVPDQALAERSYEVREAFWRHDLARTDITHCVYVAEDDGGQIVGFAEGGPERHGWEGYSGELYVLYILQEHHRKGIGRALFLEVARWLAANGFQSMLVWVFIKNPACKFYEVMGGRRMYLKQFEIGGASIEEAGYGWEDINVLLQNTRVEDTTIG